MKKIFILSALSLMVFTGCSFSILPGKEKSPCELEGKTYGTCGSITAKYQNREKLKQLDHSDEKYYRIEKNGDIFRLEDNEKQEKIDIIDGKERTVGQSMSSDVQEKGFQYQRNGEAVLRSTGEFTKNYFSKNTAKKIGNVLIKNKSLVLENKGDSALIRDLGYIQKVWIAPYTNSQGDLVGAHDIFVVIKKPQWIVGENQPKKVKNTKEIPSLITSDLIHPSNNIEDNMMEAEEIRDYVKDPEVELAKRKIEKKTADMSEVDKDLDKIKKYLSDN